MSKFSKGSTLPPEEEETKCYWAAGIHHQFKECPGTKDIWLERIQCYGQTEEDAVALRDRVLLGLELLAKQEAEEQALKPSQWPSAEPGHD